jgi:hypothetical protein
MVHTIEGYPRNGATLPSVEHDFFCNPNQFAICYITFYKLCKTYTLTCKRVLSSALL